MREPGAAGCYGSGYRAGPAAGRARLWVLGRGAAPGGRRLTPHPPRQPCHCGAVGRLLLQGRQPGAAPRGAPEGGGYPECLLGPAGHPDPPRGGAGLNPLGLGRGCRVSLCSRRLPTARSPLQPEQVREVLVGGEGLGAGFMWHFWEGWDLPRGTAPFSGAGPPGQGRAARSGAIWVPPSRGGGGGCLSLLGLPLSAHCPLPAPGQGCLGQAAGTSSLSWATARVKPHATATRPATGKPDRLG